MRTNSGQSNKNVSYNVEDLSVPAAARSLTFPPVSPDIAPCIKTMSETSSEYLFSKGYDSDGELPSFGDTDVDIEKLKIYSKPSPVISRGRGADKVLVAFHMKATGLSTAKEKGGETPIAKEDASD